MEEHLVPAVLSTQHHGHHVVKHRPGAARILREELVPGKAMCNVGDEGESLQQPDAGLAARVRP